MRWLRPGRGPMRWWWPRTRPARSAGSGRCRPTGTVPPTRRPSRTRSTWTRRTRAGRRPGRCSTELVELATAHGFHSVMARIVGGHAASIALHRPAGSRRRHRAGGRPEVPPLAGRGGDADAARLIRHWHYERSPPEAVAARRRSPVGRGGFEPPKAEPTGLQPVPFGHSGTDPWNGVRQRYACSSHAYLRRRLRGRPAGGPQRGGPGRPRDRQPVRLQGHRARPSSSTTHTITLHSSSEDRLAALREGPRGEAGQAGGVAEGGRLRQGRGGERGTARQTVTLTAGISSDKARELNKHIKGLGPEGRPVTRPRAISSG